MIDRLHKLATRRNVVILLVLDFIMMLGVMPYMGKRLNSVAEGIRPLDTVIPTYSPPYAHETIAAYGAEGRSVYQSILLGVDIL